GGKRENCRIEADGGIAGTVSPIDGDLVGVAGIRIRERTVKSRLVTFVNCGCSETQGGNSRWRIDYDLNARGGRAIVLVRHRNPGCVSAGSGILVSRCAIPVAISLSGWASARLPVTPRVTAGMFVERSRVGEVDLDRYVRAKYNPARRCFGDG